MTNKSTYRVLHQIQHSVVNGCCYVFRLIGTYFGRHPIVCILASFVLTIVFATGFLKFQLNQDTYTGYLNKDAIAHHEFAVYEQFHRKIGRPYYFGLFVTATDNGSLLRPGYMETVKELYDTVQSNISVRDQQQEQYTFAQMCGIYCQIMEPLWMFQRILSERRAESESAQGLSTLSNAKLTYPLSTVYGFELNLAPYFYGVKLRDETADDNDHTENNPKVLVSTGSPEYDTQISDVHVTALWFLTDQRRNASMEDLLYSWEMKVFDFVLNHNRSTIKIAPYGNYCINAEVLRAGSQVVPFYCIGFALMLTFIGMSVAGSELHHGQLGGGFVFITVAAVISPVLATAATFGLMLLVNFHINMMMIFAPFLILAIGVDDAFLLIHSWQRIACHREQLVLTKAERLGLVLADAGPSIFVTSLTNSMAFGIGALASPPEISSFCVTMALGMSLAFLYQITLFLPIMLLCSRDPILTKTPIVGSVVAADREKSPEHRPLPEMPRRAVKSQCVSVTDSILTAYSKFLCSFTGRLVGLLLISGYLFFAITGITFLRAELDPRQLIPKGSIILDTLDIRHYYVWKEYLPIEVIVNQQLDFTNDHDFNTLMSLKHQLESLPNALGPQVTGMWLKDFEFFTKNRAEYNFESFTDANYEDQMSVVSQPLTFAQKFNMSLLPEFLANPMFHHWSNDINWIKNGSSVQVTSFKFRVAYCNITSLGTRAQAVVSWRKAISAYSDTLNATLWDPDAPYSDVILNVRGITVKTLIVTLISMSVVCLLFVPNTAALVCAVAAITSICAGVMGFMHWWGANLDPVTMADLIIAVGFSVDYTAHVSYHYYKSSELHTTSTYERLRHTFAAVLWPMVQAGLSTAICMIPQTYSPMEAHMMFVKAIILIVVLGLAHGLFFVPLFLASLPSHWTGGPRTINPESSRTTSSNNQASGARQEPPSVRRTSVSKHDDTDVETEPIMNGQTMQSANQLAADCSTAAMLKVDA